MGLTLYYTPGSAPCHQVLLTAKALGLDLELKTVDLFGKEQLKPEYVKLNPQHTVPTLVDGDFVVWESRTIGRYLVNKYGAETKLYPQDPQTRALIDQRLDFDMGTLYASFAAYFYPKLIEKKELEESKLKKLEEALGFLDIFLEGSKYSAGNDMTLADLTLVSSVSTFEICGISLAAYPNVVRWLELMKTTAPGYQEAVQKNVDVFKSFLIDHMAKK